MCLISKSFGVLCRAPLKIFGTPVSSTGVIVSSRWFISVGVVVCDFHHVGFHHWFACGDP